MFKKFPSLTNHYQEKDISRFLECVNGDVTWSVTEKLDGANISFLLKPGDPIRYFSRNQEITGESFYGAGDLFATIIDRLSDVVIGSESIRLFGELFGAGIQKRVDYGTEKRILFYDMMIDDLLISQKECQELAEDLKLSDLFVEELGWYQGFQTAMEFNTKINTNYGPKKDPMNMVEGVVIKPWNRVIFSPAGSVFYIKKKNEEFADKMKREPRERRTYSDAVENLRDEFLSYVNDNTVQSVFSKEGEIQGSKEIGKYISLIIKDAMETFDRENEGHPDDFEKDERKYIFNCSSEVVELLKKYL